jgi:hypothetical protein
MRKIRRITIRKKKVPLTEFKIGNLKKIDQALRMENNIKKICKKVSVKTYRH